MVVKYLHEFLVEFDALDRSVRTQVRKKLDEMHRSDADAFRHEALRGEQFKGMYKLRVGDWRLVYRRDDEGVMFMTLGHRSEVYR